MTEWWIGKTPPKFYSYSPDTGEFVGEGLCDYSPLEPGVWLVPGHATLEMPPTLGEKLAAVWNGSKWVATVDRRGEVRWLDGEFVTIKDLGDPHKWGLADMQVHAAQYIFGDGSLDPDACFIRMAINDGVIEFADNPALLARRVLAKWEEAGGVIAPVEATGVFMPGTFTFLSPEQEFKQRLDDLAANLDKLGRAGVEGTPVPQRGEN